MNVQNLIKLYEKKKTQHGAEAFRYISQLLKEAKQLHRKDWLKSPTSNKDHEQSWRAFKGKNLEKLVVHIIKDEVEILGLKIVDGNALERTNSNNLSEELNRVKRNLLIDYGEFGFHLPDVDIIIYEPKTYEVIAVISSKVTLRERIAQTGYWKIKLSQDKITKHIKVFFVTPDEDKTLSVRKPAKKGRAIVEIDTDGSYVMSEEEIEESNKVKKFDKFLIDLKNLIYAKRSNKK
ncbi:DNA modification methylase [Candidatus Jorgensenbacteria bacterium CG_4_8_14_3_um_filter_38_10]|uniref:DNA modification methylase n=1 Tax=Candidatus Jorgensenbacteria bacterium CG11_big_fil_rev_8_21_14_0_20_38_23 TaxID=1974594 RepID=A0A2H0NH83_9BACT|nr:MAG: DNA modification methylase [Candidatus Jorgensenbacteria bacterium CG11_big_fil_rev_8_21_14_0_20_38_23]PIW97738.1 MAG: DNA modification methylase [Candidatus Jorgensenbacteria bacterium CG_4_8_14_3_um_filter_38_10]